MCCGVKESPGLYFFEVARVEGEPGKPDFVAHVRLTKWEPTADDVAELRTRRCANGVLVDAKVGDLVLVHKRFGDLDTQLQRLKEEGHGG